MEPIHFGIHQIFPREEEVHFELFFYRLEKTGQTGIPCLQNQPVPLSLSPKQFHSLFLSLPLTGLNSKPLLMAI
jgi:hypothetical protein